MFAVFRYFEITRRPMLWLSAALALGILVATYSSKTIFIALLLFLIAFTFELWRRGNLLQRNELSDDFSSPGLISRLGSSRCLFTLSVFAFALGYGRYYQKDFALTHNPLQADKSYQAEIIITSVPSQLIVNNNSAFYTAKGKVVSLNSDKLSSDIPVYIYGKQGGDIRRGDIFSGEVYCYYDRPAMYPGGFSYQNFLNQSGLSRRVLLKNGKWRRGDSGFILSAMQSIDGVRARLINNTLTLLPDQVGSFIAAALFGYKKSLTTDIKDMFRDVGISHVLAISGLHVGLVCAIIWFVCNLIFADRRIIASVCIVGCIGYLLMSDGHTAAGRAGIIAIIYLLGFVFKRRSDFLNSLGAAAFLMLLYNPFYLYSLGFQLSFAAVIFIACFLHEISLWGIIRKQPEYSFSCRGFRDVAMMLYLSVSAWLGVLPLTLYAFHKVAVSGLLINIIVIPLMSFALAGGMLLQLSPLLPDSILPVFAQVCAIPSNAVLYIARYGAYIPGGGISSFPPPLWSVVLYYSIFLLIFCRRLFNLRNFRHKLKFAGIFIVFAAISIVVYYSFIPAAPLSGINVLTGKFGETAVIVTKGGKVSVVGYFQRNGDDVLKYLSFRRINEVDFLQVLNKADSEDVVKNFENHIRCKTIYNLYNTPQSLSISDDVVINIYCRKDEVLAYGIDCHSVKLFLSGWLWPNQFNELYHGADYVFTRIRGRRKIAIRAGHVYASGAVSNGNKLNHFSNISIKAGDATEAASPVR